MANGRLDFAQGMAWSFLFPASRGSVALPRNVNLRKFLDRWTRPSFKYVYGFKFYFLSEYLYPFTSLNHRTIRSDLIPSN